VKSVLTESKYKQQRNKVNNLKKQANKKFYANINENLDELKSANGKLYWKTITLFSSFELDMEEKYLFRISAFSMDSYDNLKSFCGSERGGVSLDEFSFFINIAKPLSLLFNRSIQEMVFPDQWKIAHVIALFKKGDKSLPSNYRPVSLLSCVLTRKEASLLCHNSRVLI
jgi:hypothetical protein